MAAQKNIKLADDVLALVKERAAAEGLPEDQVATEAVRIGLEEWRWRLLLAKGRRYGKDSGYTEDDVQRLIQESRAENRGQ